MKQVFMCEYCGTMNDENSIREHEETCIYNPKNKGCPTCKYCHIYDSGIFFLCVKDDIFGKVPTNIGSCEYYTQGKPVRIIGA